MSLPTYVIQDNLLAPVTTGTTVQGFQDVNGEWWVAKNGISAGTWRKARDVLHATCYRAATYTPKVSPGEVIPYDTVGHDGYGLYVGTPWFGFTCPVGGWYRVVATCQGLSSLANSYLQGQIQQNTGVNNATVVSWSSDNQITQQASGGIPLRATATVFAVAADIINFKAYMSGTLNAFSAPTTATRLEMSFVGPG